MAETVLGVPGMPAGPASSLTSFSSAFLTPGFGRKT